MPRFVGTGNNSLLNSGGTVDPANLPKATTTSLGVVQVGAGLSVTTSGVLSSTATGTVTSVDLSVPNIFSVANGPITSSGTLQVSLVVQPANAILAGPTTGSSAEPAFRALVEADIPSLDASKLTSGTVAVARLPLATTTTAGAIRVGSGLSISNGLLNADVDLNSTTTVVSPNRILAGPSSGSSTGTPTFRALVGADLPAATASTLGAIKVGTGLSISNGTLNADIDLNNTTTVVAANRVLAGPSSGSNAISSFRALVAADIPSLDTAKITSGTLGTARGGTGIASTPANGQLLIGNGSGYTLATLTGGTDISITNSAGGITVAYTGSGAGSGAYLELAGGTMSGAINMGGNNITNGGLFATKGLRSYTSGGGGASTAGYYAPVVTLDLTSQYATATLTLVVSANGNSGSSSEMDTAVIQLRLKQQAAMGSSSIVDLEVLSCSSDSWDTDSFIFIQTANSATNSTGTLYVEVVSSYSNLMATVLDYFLSTSGSSYTICTASTSPTNALIAPASLPAGTQTKATGFFMAGSGVLKMFSGSAERIRVDSSGRVGIGESAPSAKLHLSAGTTTVAPLKLSTGTNLTTPAAGSFEFDGNNLYFTPASTRKSIAYLDSSITGTAANISGTLAIANGGTGLTSAGSANSILGVVPGGSALEYKTLLAGTGISITNSGSTITIENTGSGTGGGGGSSGAVTFTTYQVTLTSATTAQRIDDAQNLASRIYAVENIGYFGVYIGSDSSVTASTGFKLEPGDIFETELTSTGSIWGVTEFGNVRLSVMRGQ